MIKKTQQRNKGYTLLFAVLVSSVVLAVGISILSISKKEFLLSSSARESTSAIYVSESALECAIYNFDKYNDEFSSTTPLTSLRCMGQDVPVTFEPDADPDLEDDYLFTFDVRMASQNTKACAVVSINRYIHYPDNSEEEPGPVTVIISRGYNLGWDGESSCDQPSPRRVERAIQYTVQY